MPQTGNRVVVASGGPRFSEFTRPFGAIRFHNSPHFAISEPRPTLEQGRKDLIPVMPSACLDRHVIDLVLLVYLERLGERHLHRGLGGDLFRAMVAQKFCELRLGDGEVRSLEALPNLFVVRECPGIISPGLMAHQILLAGFFPRFNGLLFVAGFHGVVSIGLHSHRRKGP